MRTAGRIVTGIAPGLAAAGAYRRRWLRSDLQAGVVVWAMLVPQALGYSTLAGMPAVAGLYAACGALVLYWLWGSSRELNVGPEATVAIMVAAALSTRAAPGSAEFLGLAALLSLQVGLILLVAGALRIGRVADFLSRPILAGYVFGSGILVITSQLPNLLGIELERGRHANEALGVAANLDQVNWMALAIGAATIAVTLTFKRLTRTMPGGLLSLVAAILFVALAHPAVDVVGAFPSGLPVPTLPSLSVTEMIALFPAAGAIALLVYPDSLLTARSIAMRRRYPLDANREFFGIGAANLGAGLLGGFPVNGSQSRSFMVADAGGRTQLSNLVAVVLVVLSLLFVGPVFDFLPRAALAGLVIVAGLGLLGLGDFRALWTYRKTEFALAAATIAGVVVLGVLNGILVAVGLSMLLMILKAASPNSAVLGRVPGTDTYRDVTDYSGTTTYPGLLIFRFDANLFFANAGRLVDQLTRAIDAADPPVREILLDAESIYDIDSTGARTLRELIRCLHEDDIGLMMARVRTELRDELQVAGIEERLCAEGIYLEVDDAVADYLARYPDTDERPASHDAGVEHRT